MSGGYEIVVWVVLIAASVTDLLWGKIYNPLTLTAMAGGVLVRLGVDGVSSLWISLPALLTAFLIYFPLYYLKTLAAGDVKLLMAISTWMNSTWVIRLAILTLLVGAVVGLFVLLKEKGIQKSTESVIRALKSPTDSKTSMTRMPFGPAFLCSFLILKIAESKGWLL